MNVIEEAIRNWESARKGTIADLESIPEDHWDYRVDPAARSVRELAFHIADAGVAFTDELMSPDCSFRHILQAAVKKQPFSSLPAVRSKAELIDLLRTTGSGDAGRLRKKGEALATETMPTSAGQQSRLTGLWFAVGHEMHHHGQITVYTRAAGCVPALTQQIEAMRNQSL